MERELTQEEKALETEIRMLRAQATLCKEFAASATSADAKHVLNTQAHQIEVLMHNRELFLKGRRALNDFRGGYSK